MQKPDSLETPVEQSEAPPQVLFAPPTPLSWRIAILATIFLVATSINPTSPVPKVVYTSSSPRRESRSRS